MSPLLTRRPLQSKAAKKKAVRVVEQVTLGPPAQGQNVFGVAHIFASYVVCGACDKVREHSLTTSLCICFLSNRFNDTFVHITDLSGRETYVRITGGMKVKSDRTFARLCCLLRSPFADSLHRR